MICVIGAGLSGLAAAQELAQSGHRVTLVEARARLGGRVFTQRAGDAAMDLGAEWIGNTGVVKSAFAGAGAALYESGGTYMRREGNAFVNAWSGDGDDASIMQRIANLSGPDRSLNAALAELDASVAAANTLQSYVRGFHAADPADVSIRWLANVEETQPPDESGIRCAGGAQSVVDAIERSIADRCDIRRSTTARAIRWRPGAVEIDVAAADGDARDSRDVETLHADAVVVTIPLSILADVDIIPALPEKHVAASLLRMGHAMKVCIACRSAFWNDIRGLEGVQFVFASGGAFPTFWTSGEATPILNAWCGGPESLRLAGAGTDAIIAAAMSSVAGAFGVSIADLQAHTTHAAVNDWSADPYARGAYSYVAVGGEAAHATLAAPVSRTLFFAGEATEGNGYNATMEGAFRSGVRAAREINTALAR